MGVNWTFAPMMDIARDARWGESEKSFQRAIELDPGSSASHTQFALYLLWSLGRVEEAKIAVSNGGRGVVPMGEVEAGRCA